MEGFRSLYRVRVRNKGCDGWGMWGRLEMFGLFPRARGTRGFIHQPAASLRFIPAGAGNTKIINGWYCVTAVYPRWRGEHSNTLALSFGASGLSPLARGTRKLLLAQVVPGTVYPRWRGEH